MTQKTIRMLVKPIEIVQLFIDRINAQDADGLAALMTESHRFIDSLGNIVTGRESMRVGWAAYFSMVPDYRIEAKEWFCEGKTVVLLGSTGGTFTSDGTLSLDNQWKTPVAIRALAKEDKVAEWQVFADNEPIRKLMTKKA
jgi:ketosteroid isomerase-like protein